MALRLSRVSGNSSFFSIHSFVSIISGNQPRGDLFMVILAYSVGEAANSQWRTGTGSRTLVYDGNRRIYNEKKGRG